MARRFRKKLVTFMDTISNFCKTKVFFVGHKTFLINSTYIYMEQEPFFVNNIPFLCNTTHI